METDTSGVSDEQSPARHPLVLLVEDDADIGQLISDLLLSEHPSCKVLLADEVTKALSLFKQVLPQLLILDGELPGLKGSALHDLLHQEENQGVPILLLSLFPPEELGFACPQGDFLQKPFDVDTLLAKMEHLLGLERP